MKLLFKIFLLSSILIISSCDSDSSSVAPTTTPVTVVSMGIEGAESDFATNTTLQNQFVSNLASTLSISIDQIQILSITENRANFSIEMLFLESEEENSVPVSDILESVTSIETVGSYTAEVTLSTSNNAASADYMLIAANASLENILTNFYACGDNYDDLYDEDYCNNTIDFTQTYNLYQSVLEYDSTNPSANFGAALTSMITVTSDPTFLQVFEDWENWDDNNEFIPSANTDRASERNKMLGIPMNIEGLLFFERLNILNYIPINYLLNNQLMQSSETRDSAPDFGQFQDMINDVFIAKLSDGINYLSNAVNQDFSFIITPLMQGDEYQSSIEMDDTELYVMKAYMHGIRAILYLMTSYDLNGSFDEFENDHSMLDQYNGDFLTLRPGASSNLPNAHDDLNAILTTLSSAINFLSNEIDDQSNDIILYNEVLDYDNDPENEMTLLEELSSSGNFYQAVNNTVSTEICQESCTYDSWGWYYCNDTNCQDVDININNIMNNPPNNLKALLPNYSIDMVQDLDYNSIWENSSIELSTDGWDDCYNFNDSGSFYWSFSIWSNSSNDYFNLNNWYGPGGSEVCSSIGGYAQTIINNLSDEGIVSLNNASG